MMPTILHISDLHRTPGPRLDNDELLTAIINDSKRWEHEGIPNPDLVVVSGDLVQGVGTDTLDPDDQIQAQYEEANEFLLRLAEEVTDSDISRFVIVPGNHDVNWDRARRAMRPLDTCPPRINSLAFEANSRTRWNWRDQKAYEIFDENLYGARLQTFRDFQECFYAELHMSPLHRDNDSDLVYFDYPQLGLVVVGFASWHGNDCFCTVGEISSASLSLSQKLLSASQSPIAIAVWHHGVAGGPRSIDYMDETMLHKLIDQGFTVGLHGHHHYPAAAPFEARLPNRTAMTLVSAGSLAVGDRELPMGENRQFNVVVIDPDSAKVTVHVRAMSNAGVFMKSHRNDFGGNSFIELDLPSAPARPTAPSDIQLVDDAMTAIADERFDEALDILPKINCSREREKRLIQIEALSALGRHNELLEFLNPPQNADEVAKAIALLLDAGRYDDAKKQLETASSLIDPILHQDLADSIMAKEVNQ
ncbi:MAG: hypothetical protein F4Z05_13255 [Chloroflexi bacterium]|nr:hypothetical protein [Chloroflexota bacterium]